MSKALLTPHQEIKLRIPCEIMDEMDARLWDPVLSRPQFGARSALVARLIKEWCERTPVHPEVVAALRARREVGRATLDDLDTKETPDAA